MGSAGVMPGDTQRLTLTVDDDICEGGGLISMVSMLGEQTQIHTYRTTAVLKRLFQMDGVGVLSMAEAPWYATLSMIHATAGGVPSVFPGSQD